MKAKQKLYRFLCILLTCMMVLNAPMSVLAFEDVQIVDVVEEAEIVADEFSSDEIVFTDEEVVEEVQEQPEEQVLDNSAVELNLFEDESPELGENIEITSIEEVVVDTVELYGAEAAQEAERKVIAIADGKEYEVLEKSVYGGNGYFVSIPENTDVTIKYKEDVLFTSFEDCNWGKLDCTAAEDGTFTLTAEQIMSCAANQDTVLNYASTFGFQDEMQDKNNKLANVYAKTSGTVYFDLYIEIVPAATEPSEPEEERKTIAVADGKEYEVLEKSVYGGNGYFVSIPENTDVTIKYKEDVLFTSFEDCNRGKLDCTAAEDGTFTLTAEQIMSCAADQDTVLNYASTFGFQDEMQDKNNKLANVCAVTASYNVIFDLYIEILSDTAEPSIPVTSVTLDKTDLTLEVGVTEKLTATVAPDNATDGTVTWRSSDETIAKVEDGVVTAVAAGTATITAKAGEVSAACEVTVTEPAVVNKYTIPLEGNTDISNIIINGVTVKDYAVSEDGLTVDVVLDENTTKDAEAKVQLEVIAGFLQINPVSDYATFAGAIYTGAGITAEGPAKLTDGKVTFSFTASGKQYYINFSVAEAVTPPSENKYTIPLEGNTDISNIIINGVTIKDYAVSEDGLTVDVVLDENTAKDVEAKVQLEVIAGFLQINPVSDYATFAGAIYTGAGITAEGPAKLTDGKVTFSFTASGKQYYINFSVAETVIPPSEDEIATNEVIEVINALPKLETLTTADADKVKAARDAYEALTKEQKAMVSEELVKQLTEVEAKISELKKAEEEQQKAEEVAAANKAAAGTVANAVSALPVADKLIAADADAVKAARAAYEALTDAQKALVSTDTLKQLEEAEAKIAELTHVHSWDKGTVVSEATVKAAEVRKFTCTTCKETKEEGVGETLTPVLEIPGKLSSFNMKKGKTAKFTVTMANGDSVTSVKSSKSKILKATLDKKTGKITVKGVKKGTSKLTITLASGKTRTYKVKVVTGTVKTKGVTVTSVTEQKLTLNVKKTHTLKSELKPFTSTQKLTYKSSNKKIAKVSSKGKITAVAPGKATITVASGSKKVKITVTVPGITNLKSSVSVKKNKTLTLKPKTYGISEKVTYTSSNTKVATITANGKIKGIKKGTAKITVKAGTFKKTVTVKVK